MVPTRYARVIVDGPFHEPLDYRYDAAADDASPIGRICVVPFGRKRVCGVIVGLSDSTALEPARVRAIDAVLNDIAPLSEHWLELTRFAATYYQYPWGAVALAALPPLLRTPPGPRFGASLARLRRPAATPAAAAAPRHTLSPEQAAAAQAVIDAPSFTPVLLFGVTGSGKTEVYLEAIERRLQKNAQSQALLLVPEINLTPQLQARLQARFAGWPVATLHSGLPAAQRSAAWLAAQEGRARLVLGTRMAIFAPLPHLDLIVVDEEHDPSFKAGDGSRYSARDLALKRAQMANVPVLLGSATPALETWARTQSGKLQVLTLGERAGAAARAWPTLRTVDTRAFPPEHGLSAPVREALTANLARGQQSLVFINRRGYAPVVACNACGWVSGCPRCATFAAFHKADHVLRCHHCGWQAAVPRACPTCGNQDLAAVGQGTQRVEEALAALLPAARIERLDRDSTRRRDAARSTLDAMHAGEVDVLVGTQMIAKGHDFQRVSLVVVLNADAQLLSPDFRAPERLFSTLLQVAGRAGRGGLTSDVMVQTAYPQHPLLAALAARDYPRFAESQLQERAAARLPPYVHQAMLSCEARSMDDAVRFLQDVRTIAVADGVRCYDPVPMPLAKRAGVYRAQLLVESAQRSRLQAALRAWMPIIAEQHAAFRPRVRWQIEVDPQQI